jgi:hypothetical protein
MVDGDGSADPGPLRAAIAVVRKMPAPAVANAAAVLMGQLASVEPRLYAAEPVSDKDGVVHAGIRFNVVILTGRAAQVLKLAGAAEAAGLQHAAFSTAGRGLSNSFGEYVQLVRGSTSAELDVFAVGVAGPDSVVRELTRSFSSYQGAAE